MPEVAGVQDFSIPRSDGSALPLRCFRAWGSSPGESLPVLVYFHGGGFCVGDLPGFEVLARELANGAGCAVCLVDYRLAPEHPFPAAVEDAVAALSWLSAQGEKSGFDVSRIAVGGDSAGGNLATVAAIIAAQSGAPRLSAQLLVYPMTDQRCCTPSHAAFGQGHMLTALVIRRFQDLYLPNPADRLDWRASPLFAPDLSGLPPTLMLSAECDPLVDDARAYARRLVASGVAVEAHEFAGMIHGFFTLGKMFDDGARAVRLASMWLAQAFAAPRKV